ncbi:MAG TPA: TraR/DksA C4-type zinc finger protein [Segeticoccus sp.]|uniref:TraR/DksA family transcriptional regulator n=1 Tax=Segeticoccus sp. TaxID=2706531 RepID=UPI002D810DB7|nr:TraR/DksA C4-type zinc finger protein [Segeticoccus sp.]HET8601710.1 TraR/DksA C4-type zinc finger protein [Segeticoccus sp.]
MSLSDEMTPVTEGMELAVAGEYSGAVALLEQERAQATARLAGLRAEFDDVVEATLDANTDDEHDPEGATIGYERARIASLIERTEASLEEVERCLARVREGSYGTCAGCGKPIAPERLEARPTASTCITCASTARR